MLLGLLFRLQLGCHDLWVDVILGGLGSLERLRRLIRLRRYFGGIGRRLWAPILSPGYCHRILFARSILAFFQRDLRLSLRYSGMGPSLDSMAPILLNGGTVYEVTWVGGSEEH